MSDDELLSAREIGDRIGLSERTIRKWVHEGRLSATREGRSFRISLSEAVRLSGRRPIAAEAEQYTLLRGRYDELAALVKRLELELAAERRRSAALEARLDNAA